MVGPHDSSLTRVQPFFRQLLDRPASEWLPEILNASPNAEIVPPDAQKDPGVISPELLEEHPKHPGRERCFEYQAPPPAELLRWLIENANLLVEPAGARRTSPHTHSRRRALIGGDADARAEALERLSAVGPTGSAQQWWAFEGFTNVDCWIETEKLVLLVEGKRTEKLSDRTSWLPRRNQLVRNLDVAADFTERTGKPAFVLLAVEEPVVVPRSEQLREAAPHREDSAAAVLEAHYLGQMIWQDLCQLTGVRHGDLPDTV